MKLTNDVKELAINRGADLVGIAPVDRFEHAPEDGKPQYYMPDAKCVVVIATRILKSLCDVYGTYEEEGKTIGPYMWHGYVQLNWGNSWVAIQVAKLLEDEGHKALPFPPTMFLYRHPEHDLPDFYHKHAAVAAGLGEFGLNRLLLTPEFGAHQRIISIVTNAPLDPDPMYGGPKLCRQEECESLCVKICPLSAFGDKTFSVRIGDRIFEYALLNSSRCRYSFLAGKAARGKSMFPADPPQAYLDKLMEEVRETTLTSKMHPDDRRLQMFTWAPPCSYCLVKCPAPWK